MYHAHFGLEHGLFDEGIAADGAVFRAAKHDRLVAHFKLALASPSSSIVLHGPAGVGKTTLTSTALRAISTRLALAWVGGMATSSTELLELMLVELGISTARTTRMERLQLWRQFQGEMLATDSRVFVVVERTEDLSIEVLHALDQLTAPDAVGNPGANLVLLGHAGIHDHLAAPLLDSLRQRIRLRAELEPFTEAELRDYLRHQVTCAGGQYDRIFAAGTVESLHRYSRGVARLVNTLCESALDIAAVQQHKQLTPELVVKTAATVLGLGGPVPATQPAPAAQLTAATARTSAPPVETRPATATAPIFERRAQPRVPVPPASPPPATRAAPPRPAAPAAAGSARPVPAPLEIEFDGSVTDVADVALADFPVLTDAVEAAETKSVEPPPVKPAAPASVKATASSPQASPPAAKAATPAAQAVTPPAAAPAAAKTAAKSASRLEPARASTSAKPPPTPTPAAPSPTTTPLPHVAAAKAAGAGARVPRQLESEDVLRQTQTMRAIAEAKSLDDISDIDAETLFGDAELDLLSAALASAGDWPDDEESSAAPALADTTGTKAIAPTEDAFDPFGLDDNAPLELIDDATLPPSNPSRKTAAR